MATNRSDESNYPSKYSPGKWVTGAQYAVELICERKAESEHRTLQIQFWKDPEWNQFYKKQICILARLLKKYDVKVVIAAIKDRNFRHYSFFETPQMRVLCNKHKKLFQQKEKIKQITQPPSLNQQNIVGSKTTGANRILPSKKKSLLNKLRELDDEEC